MERNWEIVRKILIQLEQLGDTRSSLDPDQVTGFDPETVIYHMKIMDEAGLIEARCTRSTSGLYCFAVRLTWAGHEFLDGIRDQQLWNRVKATVREKGLSLSFDVIKTAANALIAKILSGTL